MPPGTDIDREQAHGRPVGLEVDNDGALLIADDIGNTFRRVSWAGRSIQIRSRREYAAQAILRPR